MEILRVCDASQGAERSVRVLWHWPGGSHDHQRAVYGFYGAKDQAASGTVPATTEAMKAAGKLYDPVTYEGADHGFTRLA